MKGKKSPKKTLEQKFLRKWSGHYGDRLPQIHYRFNKPRSRHEFDFAWPDYKVAVEIEGGIFTKGRHTRGVGYSNDCLKYNMALALGWRVFRLTTLHLDEATHYKQIYDAMEASLPMTRDLTGISVITYAPLKVDTEEMGRCESLEEFGCVVANGHRYLLNKAGIGSVHSLEQGGLLTVPLWKRQGELMADFAGQIAIATDNLHLATVSGAVDLALFLNDEDAVARWVSFFGSANGQ